MHELGRKRNGRLENLTQTFSARTSQGRALQAKLRIANASSASRSAQVCKRVYVANCLAFWRAARRRYFSKVLLMSVDTAGT